MTAQLSQREWIIENIRKSAAEMRMILSDIHETINRSRETIDASREAMKHLDRIIKDAGRH